MTTTEADLPGASPALEGDERARTGREGHRAIVHTSTGSSRAIVRFDPTSGCQRPRPQGDLVAEKEFRIGSALRIHLENGCRGAVAIVGPANRFMAEGPFWH